MRVFSDSSLKDWETLINDDGESPGEKETLWCIPCGHYKLRAGTMHNRQGDDDGWGSDGMIELTLAARPDVVLAKSVGFKKTVSTFTFLTCIVGMQACPYQALVLSEILQAVVQLLVCTKDEKIQCLR